MGPSNCYHSAVGEVVTFNYEFWDRWLCEGDILPMCSKMSLLRPLEIKTTSLFRPVFASPKWYFPYDVVFDIKTTSLMRPLLGSPKGGLNIGIFLYL